MQKERRFRDDLPRTRAEAIATELRRLILSGEYPGGARLRQAEIAQRFSTSTTPVREAFVVLAREGLVRQDAHRGAVVFEASLREVEEIYEILGSLETLASRLAAERLSDAQLEELTRIVEAMRDAAPDEYADLNRAFHATIATAAGRPRLSDLISRLRQASAGYRGMTVRHYDEGFRSQVQGEHEAILAALVAREPRTAERLVREHLWHNQQHFAALVERHRDP